MTRAIDGGYVDTCDTTCVSVNIENNVVKHLLVNPAFHFPNSIPANLVQAFQQSLWIGKVLVQFYRQVIRATRVTLVGGHEFFNMSILNQKVLKIPQCGRAIPILEVTWANSFEVPATFCAEVLLFVRNLIKCLQPGNRTHIPDIHAIPKPFWNSTQHSCK